MYQIPGLRKFINLFHAFSTKDGGNMANSIMYKVVDFDNVVINRERFLENIGVDMEKCCCMWVTHGDEIIKAPKESIGVSMKDYKKAVKVDGLMTNEKGIFLFLLVADCLPIILYDPKNKAVSLVHAGWKGIDLEIARKAVDKMQRVYGSKPKDVIVGIGPHAHKGSYIKENPTQKSDPRWKPFIDRVRPCQYGGEKKDGFYAVNLLGFTKKQLLNAGVKQENIFISDVDTVKDNRFFSHVREGSSSIEKQGRFACVVGMK